MVLQAGDCPARQVQGLQVRRAQQEVRLGQEVRQEVHQVGLELAVELSPVYEF